MILPSLINPWVLLTAGVVLAGTNALTAYYVHDVTQTIEHAAAAEDKRIIAEASRLELARVNGLVLDAQRGHATDMQQASINFQLKLEAINVEAQRALTRHRNAEQRLSISARCPAGPINTVPGVVASAGGRGEESRAELSDNAAEFLVTLAKRCDDTASQLAAAQVIMERDRTLIRQFNLKVQQGK